MNLQEAKSLTIGSAVYHTVQKNADGTAQRWKVTSVKTWKRTPSKVLVGLKHGLYSYDSANEYDIQFITRVEPLPVIKAKKVKVKESVVKAKQWVDRQDKNTEDQSGNIAKYLAQLDAAKRDLDRRNAEKSLVARIDAEALQQAHDQMDSAEELRHIISYEVYLRTYNTFLTPVE